LRGCPNVTEAMIYPFPFPELILTLSDFLLTKGKKRISEVFERGYNTINPVIGI
jgi:hypothetical protein